LNSKAKYCKAKQFVTKSLPIGVKHGFYKLIFRELYKNANSPIEVTPFGNGD
jgi:hypothetical protein